MQPSISGYGRSTISRTFILQDPTVSTSCVCTNPTDMETGSTVLQHCRQRRQERLRTGYSSLAYLSRLPVSELKIDYSFISGMMKNENDTAIVRSIIELGHHLNLKVVAEGVEVSECWNRLVSMGCDMVQGYYIARPLPAAEFTHWLGNYK